MPEETEKFIRLPNPDHTGSCDNIRTITVSQKDGIDALFCVIQKIIKTYLFKKSAGWTMAKARAWVSEHTGNKTMAKKQYIKAFTKKGTDGLVAVASDETIDRQGESIPINKWDLGHFEKNPVLQFGHDYHQVPIGRAKNLRVEGKKLMFEPEFQTVTQFGKEIKELFRKGFLKAWSVGFLPRYKGKRLLGNELLEISAVPVPANPEALTMAKAKGFESPEYDGYMKEFELIMKKIKAVKSITEDDIEAIKKTCCGKKSKKKRKKAVTKKKPTITLDEVLTKVNNTNKAVQTVLALLKKQKKKAKPIGKKEVPKKTAQSKGLKTKKAKESVNQVVLRALQTMNRTSNGLLHKVKKELKK